MDQDELRNRTKATALQATGRRLHLRFDAATGPGAVEGALTEARSHFDGSRVRTFIPILVERRAADTLERIGAARADRKGRGPG
ncbi:hypothetical protein F4556_006780 [Kitasatospora gansuensis]|uniref:Uncharacterized protein n=1 Tax=Kitasatospora gansuensis TaxID=258050 RepID=A0A7W7SIU5_9ACTN|nr:hypothetical protein [Kitasatospora gansuensis]MBB4951245.1 hypothetical protein [Kitasatospora gansuensis]